MTEDQMIEVERKFNLNLEDRARLLHGAEFLKEKSFTDIYYDNDTYSLTTKDRWLKLRVDNFELKVPVYKEEEERKGPNQYREIIVPEKVAKEIGISIKGDLKETLHSNGYRPFVSIHTVRKHYQKSGFSIDIDLAEAESGRFFYEIARIEKPVRYRYEVNRATRNLLNFSHAHGLKTSPVRAKAREYLRRFNPEHFIALVKAGVELP